MTVMSGRRFVLRAVKLGIRVAIVNRGVTRGEGYARLVIDAPLGIVLPELTRQVETLCPPKVPFIRPKLATERAAVR